MSRIGESATTSYTTEDYEELVEALQGIATEILRYQDPRCQASFHARYGPLPRCKSDTDTTKQKKGLGHYCENLKNACNAGNQLSLVKCQSTRALDDRDKCVVLINKLTRDSIVSSVKREVLHAFILLGYRELQKLRHEPEEDIGIAMKLKHIIVACGQYYADFCNERQRRARVDSKNVKLLEKLKVLRNHMGAVNYLKEEVKLLKLKNEELKKALRKKRNCACKICDRKPSSAACYAYTESAGRYARNVSLKKQKRKDDFSIGSHLSVIRNLIDEQENMMSGLLKMTQNLNQSAVTL